MRVEGVRRLAGGDAAPGCIASRFSETSEELRALARAADLQSSRSACAPSGALPIARESAEAMRTALNDQLRALEQLSSLSARERRDVTPPAP